MIAIRIDPGRMVMGKKVFEMGSKLAGGEK
jgi:hypothetical protein